MKTYHFEFTEEEVFALREATEFYYFEKIKGNTFHQPIFQKMAALVKPLYDNFKQVIRLSK